MRKLYDLIQNLTQAEKRHVKLRLANNKESSLLNVHYDIVSKQKRSSVEQLIKETGQSLKLVQANAGLLYEIILEDLRYTVEDKFVEIQLRNSLSDIKILLSKGFLNEAESRTLKLIMKAEKLEEFTIQRDALKQLWEINFNKGTIKVDEIQKIHKEIDAITIKINSLDKVESFYRLIASYFHDFFFFNHNERLTEELASMFLEADQFVAKNTKEKFVVLEINAMQYLLKSDVNRHHDIRREQLLLSLSTSGKENNKTSILLIISNVFTKLKIERKIKELEAYLRLLETSFFSLSEKQKNTAFMEKYYDIYFVNYSFLLAFRADINSIENLFKLSEFVKKERFVTNEITLSRINLVLIELTLITEDYIGTINQLDIYYEQFRKYKKSNQFVEAKIFEAIAIFLLRKFDIFIDKIDKLIKLVKVQNISLNSDLQVMLQFLNALYSTTFIDKYEILLDIKYRQTFKLLMYKMIDKLPMDEIREKYFPVADANYYAENDTYLQKIENLMTKTF